ncbi:MAG: hypothetical protein ACD_5C00050G0001 [uncultured bacterium]|nr:MAG: hypothetical protein ACD_5C00050G0001 [uncultured bacterium]
MLVASYGAAKALSYSEESKSHDGRTILLTPRGLILEERDPTKKAVVLFERRKDAGKEC